MIDTYFKDVCYKTMHQVILPKQRIIVSSSRLATCCESRPATHRPEVLEEN